VLNYGDAIPGPTVSGVGSGRYFHWFRRF